MSTLTSLPVTTLLDRLYAEAETSWTGYDAVLGGLSEDEQDRLMRSRTEYRDLYERLQGMPLAVSRETGRLLYMLSRGARARTIVEFGTSFGLSTIHLAAALRDNGGGRLITCEFEPTKVDRAREHLKAAGLIDLVEFREGEALQTLSVDLPETIDLVLLDGAKALYADVLGLLERRLRASAFVVADNADACPDYVARVRHPGRGYLSVPFTDDVEVSMRVG
ncbi:O-methyltransferase [Methylobacterium sp. HMF5984]|uniref:O-methyltransferase n=1 Tax=Methylobacterium sp. HMF5984 TaxID=3367370 RepID=UPI0038553DBE